MADTKKKPVNLHANHRQRMWTQFEKTEGKGFNPHQLLELLLFHSIPRRDTNPTAHLILNKFGSIGGLLEARPEELTQVEGVGPATARLLSLFPLIYDRYCSETTDCSLQLRSSDEVTAYLKEQLEDVQITSSYLLILDSRCRPRPLVQLTCGCVFSNTLEIRRLISGRLLENSSEIQGVVLAQKRLNPPWFPDVDDLQATRQLRRFISNLDIRLLDHLIFANDKIYSMKRLNMI